MTEFDADYALERWREGSQYFFAYTPETYTYRGPKVRPVTPRPPGYDSGSDFNFTGSPETQYHHRNITPETLKGIEKRENSVDDYYAEMAQRRDSGLEPIPWNEWLNRIGYIRDAMPTYYHHTREPDFKIDPDRKPDNAVLNRKLPHDGKGLWVSPDKDHWRNYHYQGRRPYLVELYSEEDLGDDPSELFVGGDQLKKMQVRSVEKKAHRTAMAWDEWAPKIEGACEECNYSQSNGSWPPPMTYGRYVIPEAGAFLDFEHRIHKGEPELFVSGIYTHPQNRNDGVAEALMRKLVEEHPGVRINPGIMTNDGQKFHDQMLEKEPEARDLIIALRRFLP